MIRLFFLSIVLILLLAPSCKRSDHFITDKKYRKKVGIQFRKQEALAKNRKDTLFKVFEQDLSLAEKEALQFLYAFMPLSDLADYDGEFFLENVRASFAARDTFSWGRKVPEVLFRHFVLPVRVNNENLDSSRWVFFRELKERIQGLSMKDAVLEVNHWCHEKVTYRGTDSRTSSPLATVKTAFGRCGEESTFTVAALRAVGIPARQCYTPRWAHSDDNHAWVEAWVDGKWHYIGACEPEPDLDMAWFTGPAKRAMLVNTNVFGDYEGPEDVLLKDERFTRINILPNYTTTKRVFARVTDSLGRPMDSAAVEFQLYNYAEFYPLHKTSTDQQNICSFLTGFGDLVVWAQKGGIFGYRKITVKNTDTVTILLTLDGKKNSTEEMDLVPPPETRTDHSVSDSARKANNERLAFEDRIRANYENTFIDSSKTWRLAANFGLSPDTLWHFLKLSRGNWRTLTAFITGLPEENKQWIFPLLQYLSEKDLRDVTLEVLEDNILHSPGFSAGTTDRETYAQYILCPRIDNELLKPYKAFFTERFDTPFITGARKDPSIVQKWISENITPDRSANYSRALLTPVGAFGLKVADPTSRDVLFVAMCRSFGIPARLEPGTFIPQFFRDDRWIDIPFDRKADALSLRGTLRLSPDPGSKLKPEYYIHFTVEKLADGFYRSLDYEDEPVMNDFPCSLDIPSGSYLVVTGNRVAGGTVLARLEFLTLRPGEITNAGLVFRKDPVPGEILGKADLPAIIPFSTGGPDKEYILAWLEPDREPTRHFIAELKGKKDLFEQWKGILVFFFRNEKEKEGFVSSQGGELPSNIRYATGFDRSLSGFSKFPGSPTGKHLPVIALVRAGGNIVYLSEGYRIGTPGEILKIIGKK